MAMELRRTPNKFGAISLASGAVVFFLIWLVFFWAGSTSSLSGVNSVHGFLIRFTSAVPVAIIMAAYLTLARQLWRGGLDAPHD